MAGSIVSGTEAADAEALAANARELRIDLWQDYWVQYEGTAAQLEGEGLIPEGFAWPKAADKISWQANGFDFRLCRTRPKGHKGSMRSWLQIDNWLVCIEVTGRDYNWRTRQSLARQTKELAAAYHRQTAAGHREWKARLALYCAAIEDQRFKAFKALVPGLAQPKRTRRTKASSPSA